MKQAQRLLLVASLLLSTACQPAIKPTVVSDNKTPPFAWHKETKEWLSKCEQHVAPPVQAVFDFDALAKREKDIERNWAR